MTTSSVRAQRLADVAVPETTTDPGIVEAYLEDASGSPPGRAAGVIRPASEAEVAAVLRTTVGPVLAQAARSSLTAGAVPHGETVLSVERMAAVGPVQPHGAGGRVRVDPGVRLCDLQRELAPRGYYYPPVPTYQEAMIGGTLSTNAGGPATFKYGVTRGWVRAVRVALFNGDVLDVERGQVSARPGETFRIRLSDGRTLDVPVPAYRLPPLKKISAGYHASDPLDLVDLFVGAEGSLGVITGAEVEVVRRPAAEMTGLVFLSGVDAALALAADLRRAALEARRSGDPREPDVRAIELMDGGSLDVLRRHGDSRRLRILIPEDAGVAVLFEVELPSATTNDRAQDELASFFEGRTVPGESPLPALFRMLDGHAALATLELAFPEDSRRAEALREFREAVPKRVGEVLAERRRADPEVRKVGGDLIVPFDRLGEMIRIYQQGFSGQGMEYAVWGHLSDGNLHPNGIPRTAGECEAGFELLLRFGDEAARRGGCPLSEHGVGRNPVKQEMLRRFLGNGAVAAMRSIKRALDPNCRFAPGVLFPTGPGPQTGSAF